MGLGAGCVLVAIAVLFHTRWTSVATANLASNAPAITPSLVWLKSGNYAPLNQQLADLQSRYESRQVSDRQLYDGFRALYQDDLTNARYFDQWVQAYPHSYVARLARGAYYYRMAWFARGEEVFRSTRPERIDLMEHYIALSRPDLMASLKMTPKPYLSTLYLLNLEVLNGSPRSRRLWLDWGTSIEPNDSLLRSRYMVSLSGLTYISRNQSMLLLFNTTI